MIRCPVCYEDLVNAYSHSCSIGMEESKHECTNCNLYSETFAYGNTEICIGDFITGYNYTISDEERTKLSERIVGVAKLYRKGGGW